uniref:Uncharacterized protein n=1 Tax=Salix viminalis TaxID=40686 RepID=A0A6N2NKX3_SALVM
MQILNSPPLLSPITTFSFLDQNQKLLFNPCLSVDSCCVSEGSPTRGTGKLLKLLEDLFFQRGAPLPVCVSP